MAEPLATLVPQAQEGRVSVGGRQGLSLRLTSGGLVGPHWEPWQRREASPALPSRACEAATPPLLDD